MPIKLEAGKRLAQIIRDNQTEKVIKIVHGYGSSGVGGSIKQLVHKSLRNQKKKSMITAFIPGEASKELLGFDEQISLFSNLIKHDHDFKIGNAGITFVIIKSIVWQMIQFVLSL